MTVLNGQQASPELAYIPTRLGVTVYFCLLPSIDLCFYMTMAIVYMLSVVNLVKALELDRSGLECQLLN